MDTGQGEDLNGAVTQSGSRVTYRIHDRESAVLEDDAVDAEDSDDGPVELIDLTAPELTGRVEGRRDDREVRSPQEGVPSERRASPPLRRILVVADLLVLALGWLACVVTLTLAEQEPVGRLAAGAEGVLIIAMGGFLMSASGLYRRRICAIRSAEVARIGRVSVLLAGATALLLVSRHGEWALFAAVAGGLSWFLLLVLERGVLREWIQGRRASGDFGAPVLVVGGDAGATVRTAQFLAEHPVLGFEVRGIVCSPPGDGVVQPFSWLGRRERLLDQVGRSRASGVVLDASSLTGEELNDVVQELGSSSLHIHISSGLRGVERRRITVSPLADETFLHVAPLGLTRRQIVAKRTVDVVVGSLALLALSPVLLLASLAIWAYDRGPVLFRQERVGHEGERFTLYKLRTMVVDAERRRAELEAENVRTGPLFKLARDPRITPVGRLLRASSVDEIPQLFNVLEGTMSLVGPRPALPEEVARFDDQLNGRLRVKPGVTGLWQVEARDLTSFELYRRYDLLYVQNWSLGLDFAVIARTITVVGVRSLRALLPSRMRRTVGDALE